MKLTIRDIGLKLSMNDLELDKLKNNLEEIDSIFSKYCEVFKEKIKLEEKSNKKK